MYIYLESAVVILTLVLLGQLLEARAHGKTNSAIKELLNLAPNMATKNIDGQEHEVSLDHIHKGDSLRVKPREKVPVDGTITDGSSTMDESMISGEPIPVDKATGDQVRSGTINGTRYFIMVAEKVGSETLLSQIVEMVNSASRSKAPIQKLADRLSNVFVPIVILIDALTFLIWAMYGPEPSYVYAFVNAIAVLVIACPCALGLAASMSVMVGVGKGASAGVFIKDAAALEKMREIDTLVVDKAGTLTQGKPAVERVQVEQAGYSQFKFIQLISALNRNSEHPLAVATLHYAQDQEVSLLEVFDFETITGKGVVGRIDDSWIALGNVKLMEQVHAIISENLALQAQAEQKQGKTISYLAVGDLGVGFVVISDQIKASTAQAIQRLQKEGLKVLMFTGDNMETAKSVSETLSLDGYKAQLLPQDKLTEIKRLQAAAKKVAMAGDGINDAPELAQADIGIAMATGTDVAIESAEITLVKGDLISIVKARELSHQVVRNIKENLFFALVYNGLGIPIAAGLIYPIFGWLLPPMFTALAMSFSSVSVILNTLRLRRKP